MSVVGATDDEIARRARELYAREIRSRIEQGNKGKYVVINVETGEYEMDADDLTASKRAKARFPDAPLFTMRVGYRAAYHLGVGLEAARL